VTVYSTLLINAGVLSGGSATFDVPAGFTCVIREVTATPTASGLTSARVVVYGDSYVWAITTGTSEVSQSWSGRHVVPGGQSFAVENTGAGVLWLVSGYLLEN
jgi:hypothetical protein